MKKPTRVTFLILIALASLLIFSLPSINTAAESLQLSKTNNPPFFSVTATSTIYYVGKTKSDCGNLPNCEFDDENNPGSGLLKAIAEAAENDVIVILNEYAISHQTILVDKKINLRGPEPSEHNPATITYAGETCDNSMLKFTAGGSIKDLHITDGGCHNPSRTLLEIDSNEEVIVEHNTLIGGNHAIWVRNNVGNVSIAFNQISNNQRYAVFADINGSGEMNIFANNISDNRIQFTYQVNCNNRGEANHNFWGEWRTAESSSVYCTVDNGKRLGAAILLSPEGAGVEAVRLNVDRKPIYAFNEAIGVWRDEDTDNYDVIIVNHGQGSESNIPFYDLGSGAIHACSNFYDVFLSHDAHLNNPKNLILSLKYNLNEDCINTIESNYYCNQNNHSKFPLWWYDPANNVTDGWDRTGQNPTGSGADGALVGQATTCNTTKKEIQVTIDDSTARPGILQDLDFTPFVVGYEGVILSKFNALFKVTEVDLEWETTSELQVQHFYIVRSSSESGPFIRISPEIESKGEPSIGGRYYYTDDTIEANQTYYYKIEVVNNDGEIVGIHGPIGVLTSTTTPTQTLTPTLTQTRTPTLMQTATLTRTLFPTRTATPYIYRSPTPIYYPHTSTPMGGPTRVRTFDPDNPTQTLSPILDFTDPVDFGTGYPVEINTDTVDFGTGYPDGIETPTPGWGYPVPDSDEYFLKTVTQVNGKEDDIDRPDNGDVPSRDDEPTGPVEPQPLRWQFLIAGIASGLVLLGAASVIIAKSQFS